MEIRTLSATLLLACLLSVAARSIAQTLPFENDYAFGLDVSFTKQHEDNGRKYYDTDGTEKRPLQIFRDHGYNWGRVMICNEPTSNRLPQTLDYVIAAAQEVKATGMRFLLDYMFSNGWANPMTQPTPSEWAGLTHEQRVKSVYDYIHRTMSALRDNGVMPEVVQVGNEIGNGFLWPDGRIFYDTPEKSQWKNLTDYLKAAARAIRDVSGSDYHVKIMLHVDHGGDIPMTQTFFDKMAEHHVDYDMIGFSFYPWSHGTLVDLKNNLHFAANRYGREILLIETGYYFQPSRYFATIRPPFPETPEGQRKWLETVNEIVLGTPNGLGKGVFWWEPMMGGRGYFDSNNHIQPIIHALEPYALPITRADGQTRIQ
jgi:arabinogalactan endo-1,4-beta-galactosidase